MGTEQVLCLQSLSSSPWCCPPGTVSLPAQEIHVWRADLEPDAAVLGQLQETLAPDEQKRAAQFRFERDRAHFLAARGILRNILARYLDRKPGELRFCYGPSGKPALTSEWGADELCFNLSHSHGLALYAIGRGRKVGIDLEWMQPHLATEQILEKAFSRNEISALRALPRRLQPEAFFIWWTRKEAYLKARGEGLSFPPDSFTISLVHSQPPALLDGHYEWSLSSLTPNPNYVATLVAEGCDWRLKFWQWSWRPRHVWHPGVMLQQNLRIVKRTPIALGVSEACNMQFQSYQRIEDDAEQEIGRLFNEHQCKAEDVRQAAGSIVKE